MAQVDVDGAPPLVPVARAKKAPPRVAVAAPPPPPPATRKDVEDDADGDEGDKRASVKKAKRAPAPLAKAKVAREAESEPEAVPSTAITTTTKRAKTAPDAARPRARPGPANPTALVPIKEGRVPFPDVCDYDFVSDWVYLSLVTYKLTGTCNGNDPPPGSVEDQDERVLSRQALLGRSILYRNQVANAWKALCRQAGNQDMVVVAELMPRCKMVFHTASKTVAEDACCVWSGEQEELHPVALIPIQGWTCALSASVTPDQDAKPVEAMQFHLAARYRDALKCLHTVLFLLDYLPLHLYTYIKKALSDADSTGDWNADMDAQWRATFDKKFGAVLRAARELIKSNCNAVRALLGPDLVAKYLVPLPVPGRGKTK